MSDTTFVKIYKLRLTLILLIAIAVCITFVISILGFFSGFKDGCDIIAPLSVIVVEDNCFQFQEINSSSPMNRAMSVLRQSTIHPDGANEGNLSGKWSVSGQYGSNTIYADVTLNPDRSYIMTETAYIDKDGFRKFTSGSYQLDMDSRLLYFASTEGVLSVYIVNEIQNDSFHAFNPNTRESYNFVRIPT